MALGVVGLTTVDVELAKSGYRATEIIWRSVIIPFSFAALVTGLIQALASQWGLVRHWWVLAKLAITVGAVLLLLLHTGSLLPALASAAIDASSNVEASTHAHGGIPPRIHLAVAAGGTLLLLLTATTLSIFKPWGKTRLSSRGRP
jgi:hypothetical protein